LLREERSRLSRSASVAKPIELALALLGLGDGGGVDRSLGLSNRQRCDRDYKSCEERAYAEEHQDIVHFGHGIPLFELRNATMARRRRSCNRLPITGLGQY
jgi:hypothetical protein